MNANQESGRPVSALPLWLRWLLGALIAIYAGLFLFTSLTRTRQLSADSLNYIDVGRNLARGQGLVQSTLVIARPLQVWDDIRTIAPFVSQPPLYPLMIALFGSLGIPFTDAALLISGLSFLAALLVSFFLSVELYDEATAWLAIAVLALAPHLASLARLAWSETLGIAWILTSLWLLIRQRKANSKFWGGGLALAAGLTAGLAFATRYALSALVLAGLAYLWIENLNQPISPQGNQPETSKFRLVLARLLPGRRFWGQAGLYLAGWALPVVLVLAHNWIAIGRLFPINLPAEKSLLANLSDAFQVLFGGYLAGRLPTFQQYFLAGLFLAGILLAAILQAAIRRGRPGEYFKDRLCAVGRYLLWLWPIVYLAFLVYQRSVTFFDELDLRLLAPAAVTLILALTALFTGLFDRRRWPYLLGIAAVVLGLAIWGQSRFLWQEPAPSPAAELAASARLSWLAGHTSKRDLVIGDTTNDIPYFFDRQAAVSFSPYPYTIFLTPSTLNDLARQYCPHYDNLYLVLRQRNLNEAKLRQLFGRYVSNLWQDDPDKYPELELVEDFADSRIFRMRHCVP